MTTAPPFPLHGDVPAELVEICRARSTADARVVDVRISAGLFSVCLRTPRGPIYLRVNAAGEQARRSPYGLDQAVYPWLATTWPVAVDETNERATTPGPAREGAETWT